MITEINGTPYGDLEEYKKALNVDDYKVMSLNGIVAKARDNGFILSVGSDNSTNIAPERCYPYKNFSGGTINNYFHSEPNGATNKPSCLLTLQTSRYLPVANDDGKYAMEDLGNGYRLINDSIFEYGANDPVISQSIGFANKHNKLNIEFKNNTSGTITPIAAATGFTVVPKRGTTNKHTVTANTFTIKFNKISSTQTISNFNLNTIYLNRIFKLSDGVFAPNPDEKFTFTYTVNSNTTGIVSSSYGNGSQISIGDNHFMGIGLGTMDTLSPSTNNTTPMNKYIFTNDYGDSAVTTFDSYVHTSNASGYTITIPYSVVTTINSIILDPIFNLNISISDMGTYTMTKKPEILIRVGGETIFRKYLNGSKGAYEDSLTKQITSINDQVIEIYILNYFFHNPSFPIIEAGNIIINWSFSNTYSTILNTYDIHGSFSNSDKPTNNNIHTTFTVDYTQNSGQQEFPSTVEYKIQNASGTFTNLIFYLSNAYDPDPSFPNPDEDSESGNSGGTGGDNTGGSGGTGGDDTGGDIVIDKNENGEVELP